MRLDPPQTRAYLSQKCLLLAALVVWLLGISAGMAALWRHASRPGSSGAAPSHWPADSPLVRAKDRPTVVLVAHPHCPCTRASFEELSRVLARCRRPLALHALLWQPAHLPDSWADTALRRHALALAAGVGGHSSVTVDEGGEEARRHGVRTSGHVLLYQPDGRLVFSGGVTAARGHAGDNPGKDALTTILLAPPDAGASRVEAPVFGCPLFGPGGADD